LLKNNTHIKLSIIVVHFNTEGLSRACLNSIYEHGSDLEIEIFLVDNGSTDNSVQNLKPEFPNVKFIRLEKGIGFGAANNVAVRQSVGEFILFLNSDTEIKNDALKRVCDFMDGNFRCDLVGCRLIKTDGSLDRACRRSFPTPLVSLYKMLGLNSLFPNNKRFAAYDLRYLPETECYQVDSLVGAFLLARKKSLNSNFAFDEDYFFYGEDIDLCYNIKQNGGEVWYLGDITVLHRKGGTTNQRASWVIYHFHKSMLIFYRKHYKSTYSWFVGALVYAGVYLRLWMVLLLNRFKQKG
jgi:GT2 family glycosyltransferase